MMLPTIILISSTADLNSIPKEVIRDNHVVVFSLNFEAHNTLQSEKIPHEIGEELLSQEERLQIFDKGVELLSWHSKVSSNELVFEGINLLNLLDSDELLSSLMPTLINLITIKRIIEKVNPDKIISSSSILSIVNALIIQKKIEVEFFSNSSKIELLWDKITIKYNIGNIPISFKVSKSNYLKIKKILESTIGVFFNPWLDLNNKPKKSIIFLEFNSIYFAKILHELKDYNGNIVLVNRRRPAFWNIKSLNIIRTAKCKVLNFDKILTNNEKQKILDIMEDYSKRFEKFWNNSDFFNQIFQIEQCVFWEAVKKTIIETYSKKLEVFFYMIFITRKVLENLDVRCIICLNEIGETEKIFLECNKKYPHILLEHGFVERIPKTERFDKLAYVNFKDRIAVWGEMKKKYLIDRYDLDPNRIIVSGSPRHDDYFEISNKKKDDKIITVLLAPNPINPISGLESTKLKMQLNEAIKKIILYINKQNNVRIIVKLHGIQLKHNEEIQAFIKKIDSKIPIYLSASVIETINQSDVVIVLSPEIHGTSTMLLESMIMQKPTMNITFSDKVPEFGFVKAKAIHALTNNDNLERELEQIIFNADLQNSLKQNSCNYVSKFLSYPGNASENFAAILKSL